MSGQATGPGRSSLSVVAHPAAHPAAPPAPSVLFCSHCARRARWQAIDEAPSRVCTECGLGLLLESRADVAPSSGSAFIIVDSSLAVCGMSAGAERLLGASETDAVNRHLTELLVPADAEAQGPHNLAVAITWAARGDDEPHTVMVRPSTTFGVRIAARIAACGPPRAALIAFT